MSPGRDTVAGALSRRPNTSPRWADMVTLRRKCGQQPFRGVHSVVVWYRRSLVIAVLCGKQPMTEYAGTSAVITRQGCSGRGMPRGICGMNEGRQTNSPPPMGDGDRLVFPQLNPNPGKNPKRTASPPSEKETGGLDAASAGGCVGTAEHGIRIEQQTPMWVCASDVMARGLSKGQRGRRGRGQRRGNGTGRKAREHAEKRVDGWAKDTPGHRQDGRIGRLSCQRSCHRTAGERQRGPCGLNGDTTWRR